jgi:cobalt-zinc-cadmium efflux system protein
MGHDHSHSHGAGALRAGARHQRRLAISFVLIAVFFVVEVVVGFWTNSLALLSDAGHMFTDVLGLGMALAAVQLASRAEQRGSDIRNTFGLYRLEILAAFVNALLLFGVAVWVIVEAVLRFGDPPDVDTGPMLVVAALGLVVNLVVFALLREGAKESINVEGAYLEVLSDTLGSVAVLVAGALLVVTDWGWVDPAFGAAIGIFILPRTWSLGKRAGRILIQAAPEDLDLDALTADLSSIEGIVDVHDLHVWTLTSGMDVASAHLMTEVGVDHHGVLDQARILLAERHGIAHATVQVEPADHEGCHEVDW